MRAIAVLLVAAGVVLHLMPVGRTALAQQQPKILSPYKSMHTGSGRLRSGAHPAIDFAGRVGDPVLAAADGTVTYATYSQLCGNGIWIQHVGFDRFTLYCHLSKMQVSVGDRVKRGQLIGAFGATGEPTMRAIFPAEPLPQLHFSLQDRMSPRNDGQLDGTFDPMSAIVGCFDPAKSYPTDQLVLTYPLRCK